MSIDANAALMPGFDNYGRDANVAFRTCLDAMSRPGKICQLDLNLTPPKPLLPAAAAMLLALADYETTCWLDPVLAKEDGIRSFLRFHTGARFTDTANEADFAAIADVSAMPKLGSFNTGSPEFPDRSTTLIIQVEQLAATGLRFSGPGIDGATHFSCCPAPTDFEEQLTENRAAFPRGVDLVFVTSTQIAALPRSVTLMGED